MAILKYVWVFLGYGLFIFINILSYTHPSFPGPIETKILFSLLSFVLLNVDVLLILIPKKITNRAWNDFTLYTKISICIGTLVLPLISLYYS
jgi:hypothetical protein